MWAENAESSRLSGVAPIPSNLSVDQVSAENLSLKTQLEAARQANAMLAEQLSAAHAEIRLLRERDARGDTLADPDATREQRLARKRPTVQLPVRTDA